MTMPWRWTTNHGWTIWKTLGDHFWARINAYDLGFNAVEEHFIRRVWEYAGKHFREVRTPCRLPNQGMHSSGGSCVS